jgi:hypothetical protein
MPVAIYQPDRAAEAGRAGHASVGCAGGALALCAHQRAAGGWSQPGTAGQDQGGQRGFGAAGTAGSPRAGRGEVDEAAFEGELRAAAGRTVGLGYGRDGKAVVRSPARRQAGVQPQQARPTFACLSQLLHRQPAGGVGSGSTSRESDGLVVCATGAVGVAGRIAGAEPSGVFARRLLPQAELPGERSVRWREPSNATSRMCSS